MIALQFMTAPDLVARRESGLAGVPTGQRARPWLIGLVLVAGLLVLGPTVVRGQEAGAQPASSQSPEATPPVGPRLALGADLSVNFGPDDPYYFNYTDYYQNALRLFVGAVGVSWATASWLDAVGEVRVENTDRVFVSALYARVRPWRQHALTVSAGRVPPVFGAFSLTRYGSDNPLVSRPLAYQYLTTLRDDVVPPSADSLLSVRGRGWRVRYPNAVPVSPGRPGVPIVSTSRWDTGVLASVASRRVSLSGGVTVGTLSDPRVEDNNTGKQLVARVEWRPSMAWTIGGSVADGAFLSDEATTNAGAAGHRWPQQALGLDAAFARGYLRVRGEVLFSSWTVPAVMAPRLEDPLGAAAGILEGVYRLHPRFDVAARGDWVGFSPISGTLYGGDPTPWDADVARVELGVAYKLTRRARLKLVYQHNWRFGASRDSEGYPATQLSVWF